MTSYLIPPFFRSTGTSSPSKQRSNPGLIAEALGMKRQELPSHVRLGLACCHAIYKENKHCGKHEHLEAWHVKVGEPEHSELVRKLEHRFARPILHRVYPWGVVLIEDSSWWTREEFFFGVKLHFALNAFLENPMLADDFTTDGQSYSVSHTLMDVFQRNVVDIYSGPGVAYLDEGDYDWEFSTLEIVGDYNEAIDSARVAGELAKLLNGRLHQHIEAVVELAKSVYARIGHQ
ncbi:hypothetical protein AB4Y40_34240 [Paraburkholderia sp. EG287B]|uniref:hypothetical protein n=1 Tax=Paraburkholderia sp. EG287B TaxID=3237010 RepID=UPI0034D2967C